MSRTFERQADELHIRAAILNQFTELPSNGGCGLRHAWGWERFSQTLIYATTQLSCNAA